jgi:hypothetical protein
MTTFPTRAGRRRFPSPTALTDAQNGGSAGLLAERPNVMPVPRRRYYILRNQRGAAVESRLLTPVVLACIPSQQVWLCYVGRGVAHHWTQRAGSDIAAAQAIFAKAGTTAYGAASARLRRDGYADYLDEDGKISEDSMTNEEARVCMVWEEAEEAAIAACCEGWAVKPTSAYLELVEIPATKPHPKAA